MSRGPIPLPDHERQRRNESARFRPLSRGVKSPRAAGYLDWPRAARDWWRAVKQTASSKSFDASDWQMALRVAQLVADSEELRGKKDYTGSKILLSEVRQMEDRLLLSVRSRRAARISDEATVRKPASEPSKAGDYRKLVQG